MENKNSAMEIKELTKFQAAMMHKAANHGNAVFAVLEPSEEIDETVKRKQLAQELAEMKELVTLGLAVDVSEKFAEPIQVCRINNKRGFIVLAISELGRMMFAEECDEHGKIIKRSIN